jgi:hypothetical protein
MNVQWDQKIHPHVKMEAGVQTASITIYATVQELVCIFDRELVQ